eukprot:403353507
MKKCTTIIEEVYGSGRHFSGIGTDFIEYPSTIIIFAFSDDEDADYKKLSAWTKNGQTIYIEISFFAKFINQHKIKDFFLNYGEWWKGFFIRLAQAKIKETTTKFQELDFYNKRALINHNLTSELSKLFLEQSDGVLNVTEVQLRKIELESLLEDAVEDKLIELQAQRKWSITQNISIITKETDMIKQYASNNITLIYANATAQATKIRAKAEAQAFQQEYQGYSDAFKQLKDTVGLTDDSALLSMMYAEMASKFNSHTTLNMGLNQPGVVVK